MWSWSRLPRPSRQNFSRDILISVFIWSSFLLIPTQAQATLTPDEVNQILDDAIAISERTDLKGHENNIVKWAGALPPAPERLTGIYVNLLQAYHFNVYGSRFYDRGYTMRVWFNEAMTRIRRYQINWKVFLDFIQECKKKREKYEAVKASKPDGDEMKTYVGNCSSLAESTTAEAVAEFDLSLKKGVIYAYHLVASFFYLACFQGTELYRFNGMVLTEDHPKIGLFNRMNEEYLALGNAIPNLLLELDAHLGQLDTSTPYGQVIKKASEKIHAKIVTYPFDILYVQDKTARQSIFDEFAAIFEPQHPVNPYDNRTAPTSACGNLTRDLEYDAFFVDEQKFINDWDLDMLTPKQMNHVRGPWAQFTTGLDVLTGNLTVDGIGGRVRMDWGPTPSVWDAVEFFHEDYMQVSGLGPRTPKYVEDEVLWDGKWNWEINETTSVRNLVHRVRLGTDLLDSVVEELKCYLNLTFTKEKRDKMVEDYVKSVYWENAKMYTDVSSTLFRPCVTANDSDLVGSCNRANHEICMPMYYHPEFQDPLDKNKGGMSLMKPKWYFRKMANGECQGKRTYITHYKICQCGFRQDCGSDLKGSPQITCQFVENDLIRKQCRGSIAYPCKSHPFAPGEYHRTCVTGFCDLTENSCERWHWHIFE